MNREEASLGGWMRRRREARQLTQAALGASVGYSADMVRKIEGGWRWPTVAQAERLADALALTPSERVAFIAVVRHERSAEWMEEAAVPPADVARRMPFPLPLTSFIGREEVAGAVLALLRRDDVRLLTLTGPGGIGKTRLATHVAALCRSEFADGVCFVSLAPLAHPDHVLATVGRALGIKDVDEQPLLETITTWLAWHNVLLILDNFEHVLDAAPFVANLLGAVPHQKALVTSRVVLQLAGEHEYAVPPLEVPRAGHGDELKHAGDYEAVRLFIARVQAVKPGFALEVENIADIAAICQLLDGIPLALELAAARCRVLSIATLRSRLTYRLAILVGGGRDLHARQRTMRATIDWSYRLLSAQEQILFRWISVFAGGCMLEEVEALCDQNAARADGAGAGTASWPADVTPLDVIDALVRASMVRRVETAGGETRFVLLETVREYALERLEERGEVATLRHQHAKVFLNLALRAEPNLAGPSQAEWLARLEQERDNLWLSLRWYLDHAPEVEGVQFVNALYPFWLIRGYFREGWLWTEHALARSSGATAGRALALHMAGDLASNQGDFAAAETRYRESQELSAALGDRAGVARALASRGEIARARGDAAIALELAEESVSLYRSLDDRRGLAFALGVLSAIVRYRGDYVRSRARAEESLAIYRALGDPSNVAWMLYRLGIVACHEGDNARGQAYYEESLAIRRAIGDRPGTATSLNNLGLLAAREGRHKQAEAYYNEGLRIYRDLQDPEGIAMEMVNLGSLKLAQGQPGRAVELCEESLALFRQMEHTRGIAEALNRLGHALTRLNRLDQARSRFQESAGLWRDIRDVRGTAQSLSGLAIVAARQGLMEEAARLLAIATALRSRFSAAFDDMDQEAYDNACSVIQGSRESPGYSAVLEQIQEHDLDTLFAGVPDVPSDTAVPVGRQQYVE